MKKILFALLLVLLSFTIYAQSQSWIWGTNPIGVSDDDSGSDIVVDAVGNSYVTGTFRSAQIVFGAYTLTFSGSSYYNAFVAKLSPSGQWLWAKKIETSYSTSIAIDSEDNLVITGSFSGTILFDTISLTNSSDRGALYVAKLTTNGEWIWAVNAVNIGNGSITPSDIAVDNNCNIYITGSGWGSAFCGELLYGSIGVDDVFTCKLSSSGNWLWVRNAGTSIQDYGKGIVVDELGCVYVTGVKESGSGMDGSSSQVYIVKYNTSGEIIWQYMSNCSRVSAGQGITTDGEHIYVTGQYQGSFQICGQSLPYANPDRVFVLKLTLDGGFEWIRQYDIVVQPYSATSKTIECDYLGNLYLIGNFGTGRVLKFDPLGNIASVLLYGNGTTPRGISIDLSGAIYLTGFFSGSVSFDDIDLISTGYTDMFVTKRNALSPLSSFTQDCLEGLEPLIVQFTDTSISGWGAITDWYWDFGDGNYSSEQNPDHVYQNAGVYSVSLTVTNIIDSTDTIVRSDYIHVLPRFPELGITDTSIDLGNVYLSSQSSPQDVWIKNIGTATLIVDSYSYYLTNTRFEVLGLTLPLSIAEGDSTSIHVRFTPLVAGVVIDSLFIHNNSTNLPIAAIQLKGRGEIVPPKPPLNVQIVTNGADAILSWDAVNQTIFDTPIAPEYYLVFTCPAGPDGVFVYNGATTGLQYTHGMVGMFSACTFYRVVAYKHYARGGVDITDLGLKQGMTEAEVMERLSRQ